MLRRSLVVVLLPASLLVVTGPANAEAPPESLAGRRAIRGESVEPARESEELRELRRFEQATFPSSEPAPNVDGVAPDAKLALPDVPVRWDPRVLRYLEFYKSDRHGRAIMSSWLRAQGRYRAMIEDALRRAKLPHALLYLSMIESGYDPLDRSSAGASGLWQFMPEGGRIYGLRIDRWVDERNDPEKATEAVTRYLGDLHARFGSWHLALAAFNAGYGAVLAAVAKYNTNDYWELTRHEDGLPWETTLYVPKFLAAAIVGENRAAFGYADVPADAPLSYERAPVPTSTSLENVARAAGVATDEIALLNPELKHGRTPPEPWMVRLPRGTAARFAASFERYRDKVAAHAVRFGERLESIARACHTTVRELKRLNDLRDASEVRPGLTLVVPSSAPLDPAAFAALEAASAKPDDDAVLVAVPDRDFAVAGRRRLFYRVGPGDEAGEVARYFRVEPADLARWNALDPDARLVPGLVLQVWVEEGFDEREARNRGLLVDAIKVRLVTVGSPEFLDLVEGRRGRKRLAYSVREGDTFRRVAARFGLTEGDLERINRMSRTSALAPGQKLTVYVPMSRAEQRAWARRGVAPGPADEPARALPGLAALAAAAEPDDDGPSPTEAAEATDAAEPAKAAIAAASGDEAPEEPAAANEGEQESDASLVREGRQAEHAHAQTHDHAPAHEHASAMKHHGDKVAVHHACPPCAHAKRRHGAGCPPCARAGARPSRSRRGR